MKTIPPDTNPPLRLLASVAQHTKVAQPDWIIQAPGRAMWVAAVSLDDAEYTILGEDFAGETTFSHRSAKQKRTHLQRPLPVWVRYPAGVIVHLGDHGLEIGGFSAIVVGDEPPGPRYQFSLGLVFAALCHEIANASYTEASLVEIVEQVRRSYVNG